MPITAGGGDRFVHWPVNHCLSAAGAGGAQIKEIKLHDFKHC